MTESVKPSLAPQYSRRRERARATRTRVLQAASQLFVERGYGATTIDAIAGRADVSVETINATFGNKRSVLAELIDITIAGGVAAAPVLDQDWVGALRSEPDLRRRIRMLAANGRAILERRSAVDEIVRGAASADPDIAALRDRGKAQRYAGQRNLLRLVAGKDGLGPGLKLSVAADVLYAIGSPETYQLLVVDRGWTGARFERWYAETIERLLFEPPR
jgi:AcrR family transcriptional regulator